jgi:uncharacterized Zn-binding protein involved in type VI secretion
MPSVAVNPPKTPVTKGSNSVAPATIPNVCKMPGPPAPFVPTPLPNIGRSALSPKGYSKKVKIEGNPVAIKGANFASQGDIASKGTGGGIVSSNTHGPTKFVGPGSLNVKIEGKNVHYLGDPMVNNCGPSGSPPNSATLMGVVHAPAVPQAKIPLECGEVGTYSELQKKDAAGPGMERDHVPSCAALNARAQRIAKDKGKALTDAVKKCLKNKTRARGIAVAIPKSVHAEFSETYKSKNKNKYPEDCKSKAKMDNAKDRDTEAVKDGVPPECAEAYKNAIKVIKEHPTEGMLKKVVKECTS